MNTKIYSEVAYACVNHASLPSDAWHTMESGKPVGRGAQAALVCRFSCPVRATCPVSGAAETISGYGWFSKLGQLTPFHPASEVAEIEVNQAAAYLGIKVQSLRNLIKYHDLPSRMVKHSRYLVLDDVKRLAETVGPVCGTAAKLALHEIRGDAPCFKCQRIFR